MSNQNRRKFIQQGSMLAGGLLLHPGMGYSSNRSNSSDELKIAVVGCGGRGTGAAFQALSAHPGNRLVAIADVFEEQTEQCYQILNNFEEIKNQIKLPREKRFVGFDAYQKAIRECDVVLLATPPAFRPEHFEFAVKEKKHVFLEKPVSCDGPGTKRILKAGKLADVNNLKVVVGLQNRYDSAHIEMVKRIQNGDIGDVLTSTCYYMKGGYKVIPRASTTSELAFQIKNYHYFTWLWAGAPAGLQIHNADIVHWVKGAYPVSAQGMGGRAVLEGPDSGDVFDHFYIEYTYPDGTKMNSEVRTIDGNFSKNGAWFIGAKGTANVRSGIKDHSGNRLWKFDEKGSKNAFQVEHDRFFEAIRNDIPVNNTEYGAYSTLTAIMGRMAAHTGRVITMEEALNAEPLLKHDISDWSEAPVVPNAAGIYPYPKPGKN